MSGKNIIKMEVLRKLFSDLGGHNISTYIQSGNVVFKHTGPNISTLENSIAGRINSDFGFDVRVIVMTRDKLADIVENNPFKGDKTKDISSIYVTFLSHKIQGYEMGLFSEKIADGEEMSLTEDVVYLYCPKGYGQTKLTNSMFESKLGVGATTRNWKTTQKLLEMASGEQF